MRVETYDHPMTVDVASAADTRSRILDVAEDLAQHRGFNGFSYADIAAELDLRKASLHYHFPSKTELGEALLERYAERFDDLLSRILQEHAGAIERLTAYVELYAQTLRGERMCLCGMVAAEVETLPVRMRDAVVRFFDANEAWVAGVLADGAATGELELAGAPLDEARLFVSSLEGAMLVARPYRDPGRFSQAAARLVAGFGRAAP